MSEIINTTTASYEDRDGAKYSYTNVLTVDLTEEVETPGSDQLNLATSS